eukprot:8342296-Prorocentrum_lima.AAC.1
MGLVVSTSSLCVYPTNREAMHVTIVQAAPLISGTYRAAAPPGASTEEEGKPSSAQTHQDSR